MHLVQYVFSYFENGCGFMGFPLPFYRDCFWAGGSAIAYRALYIDIAACSSFAFGLGIFWRYNSNIENS
jgi:hypothetical protein